MQYFQSRLSSFLLLVVLLSTSFLALAGCVDSGEEPLEYVPALKAEIDSGPQGLTNRTTATFEFSCNREEGCEFYCTLNDEEEVACRSGVRFNDLANGTQTFSVVAVYDEKRSQPASRQWEVDSERPRIINFTGPPQYTAERTATFGFECSKGECSYECRVNEGRFEACESGIVVRGLVNGPNRFTVRITDGALNFGAEHWRWTVDTERPLVTDLRGPQSRTNATSAVFEFGCSKEDCVFECALGAGDFVACEPGVTYTGLADGAQTFRARASDSLGNQGPAASYSWEIDTVEPEVENLTGPLALTNQTTALLGFDCSKEDCSFECTLSDSQGVVRAAESCEGGVQYTDLGDETYTFSVVATDVLGTRGEPATWSWTVDTVVPEVENLSGPASLTNETSAQFGFQCSKAGCSFECTLSDSQGVTSAAADCASGVEYSALGDGSHMFSVVARDEAGNVSAPAVWSWSVDTVVPEVENLVGPLGLTNETIAQFDFECSKADCLFRCTVKDANGTAVHAEQDCTSGVTYENLGDGGYTFLVRASDPAGNESAPASRSWTVDTVAPEVENLSGPASLTSATTAAFGFGCSKAGCDFYCQLSRGDGTMVSDETSCLPGVEYVGLADGAYTFSVRAVDGATNEGGSSVWNWTVDTTTPVLELTAETTHRDASFSFGCTNKACSYECALAYDFGTGDWETGDWSSCSSPYEINALEPGDYELFVRATDALGNQVSESHLWTVLNIVVAILHGSVPPEWLVDVQEGILDVGAFSQVDLVSALSTTPTLDELVVYDAVLVITDGGGFADAVLLGNILADYFDAGGNVVVTPFANASIPVQGRFAQDYMLIAPVGQEQPSDSLGVFEEPDSPLVENVTTLEALSAWRSSGGPINGGIVVARWNSGAPLIVRGEFAGRNRVDLNLYPPSSAVRLDFWSGDGFIMISNALLFR